MYGDAILNEEQNKSVQNEYGQRLQQLSTVPIEGMHYIKTGMNTRTKEPASEYDEKENKVYTNDENRFHELSHAIEIRQNDTHRLKSNVDNEGFVKIKNNLVTGDAPNKKFLEENYEQISSTEEKIGTALVDYFKKNKNEIPIEGDEWNSKYQNTINKIQSNPTEYAKYFPEGIIDKKELDSIIDYNKKSNEDYQYDNYYNNNTEIKARINGLKLEAFEKYKYNPSEPFDINKFEELKKHRYYKELKDKLKLDDSKINELSKYIASNNKTIDNIA